MFWSAVLAYFLLLLLGEADERAGLDRLLKANTSKKRSLSLFRQGLHYYQLIPDISHFWRRRWQLVDGSISTGIPVLKKLYKIN